MSTLLRKSISVFVGIIVLWFVMLAIATWTLPKTDLPSEEQKPNITKEMTEMPIYFPASIARDDNGEFPSIEFFNNIARKDDYIVFLESSLLSNQSEHIEAMKLVRKGKTAQEFSSWRTANAHLSHVSEYIDAVYYNLDQWGKSNNEWQDISLASQTMAAVSKEYNLEYIGQLGYNLAVDYTQDSDSVQNMSRHADRFAFASYSCPDEEILPKCSQTYKLVAEKARLPDSEKPLIMGISLREGSFEDWYSLMGNLADTYDSAGIVFSADDPGSLETLESFIEPLREKRWLF